MKLALSETLKTGFLSSRPIWPQFVQVPKSLTYALYLLTLCFIIDYVYTNVYHYLKESCIQMYGIPSKAGQWRDNGCWDREGFVCQTTKRKLNNALTHL